MPRGARRSPTRVGAMRDVHRVCGGRGRGGVDDADAPADVGRVLQVCVVRLELPARREGRGAVAEALVDRRLRRGESGEWFAAPRDVVELLAPSGGGGAAPTVRRVHGHHAHAGDRQLRAAGDGEVERVRRRRSRRPVVVVDARPAHRSGVSRCAGYSSSSSWVRASRSRSGPRARNRSTNSSSRTVRRLEIVIHARAWHRRGRAARLPLSISWSGLRAVIR